MAGRPQNLQTVTTAISTVNPHEMSIGAADTLIATDLQVAVRTSVARRLAGVLEDGVLLLLAALAFPVVILLLGSPIVFCVQLILEIFHRL